MRYEYRVVGADEYGEWEGSMVFPDFAAATEWIEQHRPLLRHSGQSISERVEQREVGEWRSLSSEELTALAFSASLKKERTQ